MITALNFVFSFLLETAVSQAHHRWVILFDPFLGGGGVCLVQVSENTFPKHGAHKSIFKDLYAIRSPSQLYLIFTKPLEGRDGSGILREWISMTWLVKAGSRVKGCVCYQEKEKGAQSRTAVAPLTTLPFTWPPKDMWHTERPRFQLGEL